jgi:signal transduction histidine kinase
MKVSHRLFLAVVPSIFGVVLVAALAYWGEYQRTAPEWFIVVAGVTAVVSLVVTWRNTRFVAHRIERLASQLVPGDRGPPRSALAKVRDFAQPRAGMSSDEIDSLASEMDRLSVEATAAQEEIGRREAAAALRIEEYGTLLAECASSVDRQLEQVRLPLHILLENHFGPLNENQEEMLGAARQAADAAGVELRRLQEIASLDRGALSLRRDPVQVADLLRALQPQLVADGARRGIEVAVEIAPGLPRVMGDRGRLQEALELLLGHVVAHADVGQPLVVAAERLPTGGVVVEARHAPASMLGPDVALARRVIAAHGGSVELLPERTTVSLAPGGPASSATGQ